jgi:hypothetical protein
LGIVHFKLRKNSSGQVITDAEALARYLAKDLGLYLSKDFDSDDSFRDFGGHRYHPSRGHEVPEEVSDFQTYDQALAFIQSKGTEPVKVWSSFDDPTCDFFACWLFLDRGRVRFSSFRRTLEGDP